MPGKQLAVTSNTKVFLTIHILKSLVYYLVCL